MISFGEGFESISKKQRASRENSARGTLQHKFSGWVHPVRRVSARTSPEIHGFGGALAV